MSQTFIQRAGLWASHSLGSLLYTLLFAAIFFVPCFFIVDRHPKRWIITTLRVLGVASLLGVVLLIGAVIHSGAWAKDLVLGAMFGTFVLVGAALGFFRAASHGVEVATLQPEGDAVAHWQRVLAEHPRWWIRSRAARELGATSARTHDARAALASARAAESNRHVRRAITASLATLANT